ncbi:MAG: SDR family oxidoreductase [Alphaproteobacteria bacterium]|nr:SDR family oxidoreductase [Alphaproteobacteria bacterium]MCB9929983.1 SDR family oxidoreductase [Alphaproteobacteria bacterium]
MANTSEGRLAGRIALITGASRGLGAAVAERFAAEGAHLILVARTQGGLEETDDRVRAAGGSATLVPLDLTQFDEIDRMAAAVAQRFGRLDILVGNAGVLPPLSPVDHLSPFDWQTGLDVNLTANWRLIRAFHEGLRRSEAGRVIMVTSAAAMEAFAYWSAYAATKAGLEALISSYAKEVERTTIRANLLDPGTVRTDMRAQAFPGEEPESVRPPEAVTPVFVSLAEAACTLNGQVARAYG